MAPTQRQQINALANLAQAASHAEWKPFEQPLLPKQPATFDGQSRHSQRAECRTEGIRC